MLDLFFFFFFAKLNWNFNLDRDSVTNVVASQSSQGPPKRPPFANPLPSTISVELHSRPLHPFSYFDMLQFIGCCVFEPNHLFRHVHPYINASLVSQPTVRMCPLKLGSLRGCCVKDVQLHIRTCSAELRHSCEELCLLQKLIKFDL